MFSKTLVYQFALVNLVDTFYKKNVISFSNDTFVDLKALIHTFLMHNVHNINLDSSILHPLVFHNLTSIHISGSSLNSIEAEIFRHFKQFSIITISSIILRKLNHKQGIEWIKDMNYDVKVNLNNLTENDKPFFILTMSLLNKQRKRLSKIYPDEDFCIYRDFPFNQFIIISEYLPNPFVVISKTFSKELTCTYLWLVQYYEIYYGRYNFFDKNNLEDIFDPFYFQAIINSTAFKSISKCDFEKRIDLCNKSNYKIKDIWDENDFLILNKKIQIAFKILIYPISLLGLITNLIVVIVILKKENSELFKEYKQYTYLYLNSIICIMISVIELLSWMTECFYPFEVFCPEIRKLVAIQFFKIIFTECFVTMSRFMLNFTYIAFSLNRISLIGKDHGKLVTFMSKLGVKKYMLVTFLISCSLSWIKGFKYQINYFYPAFNFPISNELGIIFDTSPSQFEDFYFTFNLISDLVNYLVFVVICIVIDICMVVQLRRTLEEKAKKSESLNQKQNQNKKAENEEVVNKAIKMVVLNSSIGILCKLPVCFIPLLNLYAEFYFKKEINNNINNPFFGEFYSMFYASEFFVLIQDISHLLYVVSLSIQLFIYKHYDKKFRTGYEKLKSKSNSKSNNKIK